MIIRIFLFILLSLVLGCSSIQAADKALYFNTEAPVEKRVDDLISRMTLEEKASMLFWGGSENKRLSVPLWGGWNQCLHGVWSMQPTTLFPVPIAMAATWNPSLIKEAAGAISDEARALYNQHAAGPNGPHGLVYRAPVINISRDPRWGRIQECWGEDPHLTGKMATAFIKGLQGDHPRYLKVAATLKHFAVNNQESNRMSLSASVPENILHEYYFPHWKQCIDEAKPQSVMAAYNAVNGTPCAVNKYLLTDVLKKQWRFEGFVVSDLGGIAQLVKGHKLTDKMEEAAAKALSAGCDVDDIHYRNFLPLAVKQNLVSEKTLDQALRRLLKVAFRLGVFDSPDMVPYSKTGPEVLNCKRNSDLALSVARQSIVLLKNEKDFLPLKKVKSLAVIGPVADTPVVGNYFGKPLKINNIKDALQSTFKNTVFCRGCNFSGETNPDLLKKAASLAANSDCVILCLGTDEKLEAEELDRKDIELPACQKKLMQEVLKANSRVVLILANAGPVSVPFAKENIPAILQTWYSGQAGSQAIVDTIFGKNNPGGKLPYTIYKSASDLPPQDHYDIREGFTYMYLKSAPLFPFGHGLSYSSFKYQDLKLSQAKIPINKSSAITVSLNLTNTGKMTGDEVVQIYVRPKGKNIRLVAFKRLQLKAGEKQELKLSFQSSCLASYSSQKHQFEPGRGEHEILAGSSSGDIRLQSRFIAD